MSRPVSYSGGLPSVSSVASRLSDQIAASPSILETLSPTYNTFGKEVIHSKLENPADLVNVVERASNQHSLLSVFTPSSHLIQQIPTLYSLVDARSPTVFHTSLESNHGDYSNVMAVRHTGVAIFASSGTYEVVQSSVLAHITALRASIPVLNVFPSSSEETSSALSSSYIDRAFSTLNLKQYIAQYHSGTAAVLNVPAHESIPEFVKPSPTSKVDFHHVAHIAIDTAELLHIKLFEYTGSSDATDVVVVLGTVSQDAEAAVHKLVTSRRKVGVLRVRLYRPWSDHHFLSALPTTVERIAVLDVAHDLSTSFGPLFLDVATSFNAGHWSGSLPIIREAKLETSSIVSADTIHSIFDLLHESHENKGAISIAQKHHHTNGYTNGHSHHAHVDESSTEVAYVKLLSQTFKDRLVLSNVLGHDTVWGKLGVNGSHTSDHSTEYGFGLLLTYIQRRNRLEELVSQLLSHTNRLSHALASALQEWNTHKTDAEKSEKYANEIIDALSSSDVRASHPSLAKLWEEKELLSKPALWLVGGEKLSYDVGNSGVHQVISSKENINILVLDMQPYSEKIEEKGYDFRKKDIGLYAMTYGGVYTASIALNSSYAQALRALKEAEAFPGPSVVLGYAPHAKIEHIGSRSAQPVSLPLAQLKETKMAVDSGYWPLYRWNPALDVEGKEPFQLDSDRIKKELKEFLTRENHYAILLNSKPDISTTITDSAEIKLARAIRQKAQHSYDIMLGNLNTTPILILYGSDGSNGSALSKRIAAEAKQRGLRPRCMPMDDFEVEDLHKEQFVVFVVSTAGQGEFPTNSKQFWKTLQGASAGSLEVGSTKYAVFGLGDSHYWPLPEDAIYFAKAGRDLDEKLAAVGFHRFASYGIGDDQDPDGYMTGFNAFAPHIWKALGVDNVEVTVEASAPPDDYIKEASNYLRGTIKEGLEDTTTGRISELDTKLTKFHGTYMQDDRDIREDRARQGLEPAYSFMIRARLPGGVITPDQWLALDKIADTWANGTIKITTRQTIQFHGIIKKNMKKTMQAINHALMGKVFGYSSWLIKTDVLFKYIDTIAACGDVNRNVMLNPNPEITEVHQQIYEFGKAFSEHLLPKTNAYHEIWLDKKLVTTTEHEPIYGKTYLPRKFKMAIAVPPSNDVDIFANDLGYIAIVENKKVVGFNVTVGGGMGMTHGNKKTYPRLADVLGYVPFDKAIDVGEKVVLVQRDYGDRTNRKHARLKYTIEDRGIEWFKDEVEKRLGYKIAPAKPYHFTRNGDNYGWSRDHTGKWHYTLFITNGRVKDTPEKQIKEGLRQIALVLKGQFRFTPNQHLILSNIESSQKAQIERLLAKYELSNDGLSGLRLNSMACVALPTCALAMAESERYLPSLITKIEDLLEEHGLREEEISIRMTGCPNGCARPQIAEIAFVGKAPGTYNMYLGGGFTGERLNKIYKESVGEEDILRELAPIIRRYARERHRGEHFGDFVVRVGIVKATKKGPDYHD
ncbi:hypothetical protein HK098_002612 [Nowakowskiella sp. JEL0407]|nr:hypothetical protein HK098_002612 [Nowakowskiella sp. JEL0407]